MPFTYYYKLPLLLSPRLPRCPLSAERTPILWLINFARSCTYTKKCQKEHWVGFSFFFLINAPLRVHWDQGRPSDRRPLTTDPLLHSFRNP